MGGRAVVAEVEVGGLQKLKTTSLFLFNCGATLGQQPAPHQVTEIDLTHFTFFSISAISQIVCIVGVFTKN